MAVTQEKGYGVLNKKSWFMGIVSEIIGVFGIDNFILYIFIIFVASIGLGYGHRNIFKYKKEKEKREDASRKQIEKIYEEEKIINRKIIESEMKQFIQKELVELGFGSNSNWDRLEGEKEGFLTEKQELQKKKRAILRRSKEENDKINKKEKNFKIAKFSFITWVFACGILQFRGEIYACAKNAVSFSKYVMDYSAGTDEKQEIKKDKTEEYASEKNQEEDKRDELSMDIEFCLDNINEAKLLGHEDDEQFFVIEVSAEDFRLKAIDYVQALLRSNKKDTYTNHLTTSEEVSIDSASLQENIFLGNIKKAEEIRLEGDYQKWAEALPCATTLEKDIIEPRVELAESGKCNAELAFLIANNYQRLALEYLRQEGDSEKILYYYVKSIIWTINTLEYKSLEKEMYFHYLKARYKDIKDYQRFSKKYKKYKKFASQMYGLLEKYHESN